MPAEISLIIAISLILLVSPFISNILKIPVSIVEIILGALFTHNIAHENKIFEMLAEFGFLYLMLLAGMEVNLKDIINMKKSIIKKGIIFISLIYLFSIIITFMLHLNTIFIVILPLISIGLMLSIQNEIGKKEWLNLAIKIGVFGELISILILTIVSGYFEYGLSIELLKNIAILFFVLATLAIIFTFHRTFFWWFPSLKYTLMPKEDKYFQDVRLSMSLFFIVIALLLTLHIDLVLGAFVVGVFVNTFFSHNKELEHKLAPFGFGFIITIFFIHVGSTLKIENINLDSFINALLIIASMLLIRIISAIIFFKEIKLKIFQFALSLSMPLTLLIATATIAHTHYIISDSLYNIFVLASILEVLIVMITIKILERGK